MDEKDRFEIVKFMIEEMDKRNQDNFLTIDKNISSIWQMLNDKIVPNIHTDEKIKLSNIETRLDTTEKSILSLMNKGWAVIVLILVNFASIVWDRIFK